MPMRFKSIDEGSLAPLGIGLAALTLSLVIAVVSAGSLFLTERRLTSVAEATALSVIASGAPTGNLIPAAKDFLALHPLKGLDSVRLVDAFSADGKTVTVRLCSRWVPLLVNYMFSETGTVCSEALARRGR